MYVAGKAGPRQKLFATDGVELSAPRDVVRRQTGAGPLISPRSPRRSEHGHRCVFLQQKNPKDWTAAEYSATPRITNPRLRQHRREYLHHLRLTVGPLSTSRCHDDSNIPHQAMAASGRRTSGLCPGPEQHHTSRPSGPQAADPARSIEEQEAATVLPRVDEADTQGTADTRVRVFTGSGPGQ